MNNNKKGVIYTCITGGYDDLINHTFINQDWDYVCFTDDLSIVNAADSFWDVRPLLFDKLDNVRNQRWHKIHPHILFTEYKKSIWLDANINILNKDLFADIDMAIAESRLISIAPHPVRNCIYDELITCVELGKDNVEVMREQVNLIRMSGFPEKQGLFESNIMYREHHDDRVIAVMNDWWWWVENYSRRDQLSLPYVIWQHKLDVKLLTNISYRHNPSVEFIYSASHVTKEELLAQKEELVAHHAELQQALEARDNHIVTLNQAMFERDKTIDELYRSTSWRFTMPLRIVGDQLKKFRLRWRR